MYLRDGIEEEVRDGDNMFAIVVHQTTRAKFSVEKGT